MIFDLPTSLDFGGRVWEINTDYRDILRIIMAFEDQDLEAREKQYVCLCVLYKDFEKIPADLYPEALKAALGFIDNGMEHKQGSPRTMDWEQDATILFPALNRAAGCEIRSLPYLHWWTFTGYFLEIKDSVFATVLSIRQKKMRGKKLEKWEQEFWKHNKQLCVIERKLTEEEQAEKKRLEAALAVMTKS